MYYNTNVLFHFVLTEAHFHITFTIHSHFFVSSVSFRFASPSLISLAFISRKHV